MNADHPFPLIAVAVCAALGWGLCIGVVYIVGRIALALWP